MTKAYYCHPNVRKSIDDIHCKNCQQTKIPQKRLGVQPGNDLTNTPYYDVTVGVIGPQSSKSEHFNGEFYALRCMDANTNLVEFYCG